MELSNLQRSSAKRCPTGSPESDSLMITTSSIRRALVAIGWSKKAARQRAKEQNADLRDRDLAFQKGVRRELLSLAASRFVFGQFEFGEHR
jgi:hypothetical protein